jgi:ribose transport system ATP-binding protein
LEQASAPPAVELRNISKVFGTNRALDQVDLTINQGEVLGLLGQNGSGKSTLVKILSGVYDPEPGGSLKVGGEDVPLPLPPGQASEIGLSFVYQNLALAPGLTVLENLTLGQRVTTKRGFKLINWASEHKAARVSLERYQVYLDLDQKVGELAPVDQARLAIVRAAEDLRRYRERTGGESSVLVLDEPTVFLPEEEVDRLFDLIRQVVADGAAVLFISHDLNAVQAITDRLVVLRDGRVVGQEVTANVNEDAMVDLIVGASASARAAAVDTSNVTALVEDERAVELTREAMQSAGDVPGQGESFKVEHLVDERLHDVSFEIGAGEILGVAGLIGSGAEELPYLLFGARQAFSGTLCLGAERLNVDRLTPPRSVRERIALVPADRAVQGLSQGLTLWENIIMLVEDEHYRGGIFRRGELEKLAREAIDQFLIRPALAYATMGTFSGGNQQKALMAKWLIARPRLLLLHEPTQGVDVGARRDIYRFVKAAATLNNMAVLWVTTEFGELAEVCDRVIVLAQGRHTETLAGEELSEEAISAAALRQQTREAS